MGCMPASVAGAGGRARGSVIGPYTVLRGLDDEASGIPVPERRFIGRSVDGDRTVLIGAPLPGADPGRFLAGAETSRYLLGRWSLYVTNQGYSDDASSLPDKDERSDGSEGFQLRATSNIHTPVVAQGNALWAIAADTFNEVSAVRMEDGHQMATYEVGEADRQWLVADGNRVFVMNDDSLYALPVF